MKKIVAILVVLTVLAGAAFADTAISGNITVRGKIFDAKLDGDSDGHSTSSGQIEVAYIQLQTSNDDGTFGGLARIRANENAQPGSNGGNNSTTLGNIHRAFIWWKPIEQLEVFFGKDDDGKFAFYNAWAFYQGQEGYQHEHNWRDWRRALGFTHWDTFGFAFTLRAVEGLTVNLVVPVGKQGNADYKAMDRGDRNLDSIWGGSLGLSLSYAIPDIGTLYFGYKMPGDVDQNSAVGDEDLYMFDSDYKGSMGTIGLAFRLTSVDNFGLLVGGSARLPGEDEKIALALALIADYNVTAEFGVLTRWRFESSANDGYSQYSYVEDATTFGFDIQPYYKFGSLTGYLSLGMNYRKVGDADAGIKLILNPYIRVPTGRGEIRLGLLYKDPSLDAEKDATLALPITFSLNF